MAALALSAGLIASGALGFLMGAKPEAVLCLHPGARRQAPARARAAIDLLYPLAAAFFAGFVFSTLVPEALTHSRSTFAAFAAGLLGMAVLSRGVLKRDPCCEGGHEHGGIGLASLAAMAVCSVNDGLLLGLTQPGFVSGLNLGMLLHKITASFAVAQVLLRSGFRGASLAAAGAAYVAVSPVALQGSAWPAVSTWGGSSLLAAVSAGVLAYISLASLAPHASGILRRHPGVLAGFGAALLLALGLGFWHRALHEAGGHGGHAEEAGHSYGGHDRSVVPAVPVAVPPAAPGFAAEPGRGVP